jgi:F0F1-type ATP synthase assembly protein I
MNKAADSTTKTSQDSPFVVGTLAFDILGTAWRMTVPVVLLAVGGLLLDKQLNTAPWMTLLGVVIGFGFSALLVKKQIEAINRLEQNEENK